jgi:hypothetical protein
MSSAKRGGSSDGSRQSHSFAYGRMEQSPVDGASAPRAQARFRKWRVLRFVSCSPVRLDLEVEVRVGKLLAHAASA